MTASGIDAQDASPPTSQSIERDNETLPVMNIRLVTLVGAGAAMADAMRDSQEILEKRFIERGIDVRPIDLGDWSLAAVPAILRAISSEKPDVLLMQYPTGGFGASLGPIGVGALQRIAPLVVMLHEFTAAHPLRKLAIGALLARATLIGLAGDREAAYLRRLYPWVRNRLRHIPIASNLPRRSWSPTVPPRVTYFGQLRPEKGLETFFACQSIVAAAIPEVEFLIIGATVPKYVEYSRAVRAQAQAQNVRLLHGPEAGAAADALSQSSVALLPFPDGASFRRGTLFAAVGCGVPLVTNVGRDTPSQLLPFLEPAGDVASLCALTLRYLRDERSRTEASARSLRLSDLFGWDKTVTHYLRVFAEVAGSKPALGIDGQTFAPDGIHQQVS